MSTRFRTRQPAGRWGCPDPGSTSTKTALPPRAARRQALAAEVRRLFAAHRGTYGSPRITADLREAGWTVSENTVAAMMREQGLTARRKKKRRATTRPGKGRWRAPDLVKRDFPAQRLNRKWYGEGTRYPHRPGQALPRLGGHGPRRVVGFALGEHHDAALAYSALVMAVAVRGGQVCPGSLCTPIRAAIHRGPGPAGLRPAGHLSVHGLAGLGAG